MPRCLRAGKQSIVEFKHSCGWVATSAIAAILCFTVEKHLGQSTHARSLQYISTMIHYIYIIVSQKNGGPSRFSPPALCLSTVIFQFLLSDGVNHGKTHLPRWSRSTLSTKTKTLSTKISTCSSKKKTIVFPINQLSSSKMLDAKSHLSKIIKNQSASCQHLPTSIVFGTHQLFS